MKSKKHTKFILVYFSLVSMLVSCSHQMLVTNNRPEYEFNWEKKNYDTKENNGISLERLYQEDFLGEVPKDSIIVAVLDVQIDIDHSAIKNQLWINTDEIPDNNIDDDHNGYIDDVHGWNFLGLHNNTYFRYQNFEYVRLLREKGVFLQENIPYAQSDSLLASELKRAERKYDDIKSYYSNWLKSIDFDISMWPKVTDSLKKFFPQVLQEQRYDLKKLDSLYNVYKINDKSFIERRDDKDTDLGALIYYMSSNYKTGMYSLNDIEKRKAQLDSILLENLNIDLNRRVQLKANHSAVYGNNKLNLNTYSINHNTEVSSVIIGNIHGDQTLKPFHKRIFVMPISLSVSGDEHDDDISNAIRYAVDNGAKVINMSFGKEFSLFPIRVQEALQYAELHNVLVVHAAGNNRQDIDSNPCYPNDYNYYTKKEIVGNFINVGSISQRKDSTMVSPFSNYGKENVDLFAPGENILVAKANEKYTYDSGTSLACPMVSGTAAILWLYFPNLSVQEVKHCILDSGNKIEQKVLKPGTKDEYIVFDELCKTGKVLDIYNAFYMAKSITH